ncbi:aspartate/glutamate racemase family protein [Thalassobaculum sp.]|uniref:aspartate/glutamate racemase family protein n=1 Tax=Thalassobaculum sp. TaxID=2022740 RepID=UPI0032EF0577
MKIVVVNPNTTAAMTEGIGRAARAVAAAGTEIVAVNPAYGPASIEGWYDEVFSVPGLLAEIAAHPEADGYVVACFDDPGLDAARSVTDRPVIGIGEAGYHVASLVSGRFGVITTLARSIGALETNLLKYGLDRRCCGVRAVDLPVLALHDDPELTRARLGAGIEAAKAEDRAEAIVLGCAGMAELAADLTAAHGLPVIDGVAAAVKLIEGLVGLGVRNSRIGGYSPPLAKPYAGAFARFAPKGG